MFLEKCFSPCVLTSGDNEGTTEKPEALSSDSCARLTGLFTAWPQYADTAAAIWSSLELWTHTRVGVFCPQGGDRSQPGQHQRHSPGLAGEGAELVPLCGMEA